jgi:hypothetical protein
MRHTDKNSEANALKFAMDASGDGSSRSVFAEVQWDNLRPTRAFESRRRWHPAITLDQAAEV